MKRRRGSPDWMTPSRFEALVLEAIESIPAEFQKHLDGIDIVIELEPDAETLREVGCEPGQDTIYGLYQGFPLSEQESAGAVLPNVIVIYSRPLCEEFGDEYHLRREIRRTVIHEVGHFFGFDDAELEKKGYG